jgi:hypothetical protein
MALCLCSEGSVEIPSVGETHRNVQKESETKALLLAGPKGVGAAPMASTHFLCSGGLGTVVEPLLAFGVSRGNEVNQVKTRSLGEALFKKLLAWATVVGMTAGTLLVAAPAATAGPNCRTYRAVCVWHDEWYQGPRSDFGAYVGEYGAFGWHDRVSSYDSNLPWDLVFYENPWLGGRGVIVPAYSYNRSLGSWSYGLNWWENWNDRIDSHTT